MSNVVCGALTVARYYRKRRRKMGELAMKNSHLVEGPAAWNRFDSMVAHVVSVPRAVILEREAEYQRQAAANPNRRGPKRKAASASPAPAAEPLA